MREMKDSGVRWIGKIPTKWTIAKAKNCVEIQNGSDPKTEGSIPVYGSGSMSFKTCGEYKEGPSVLIGRKGATLHIPHYISSKFWNVDTAFNVYSKSIFDLKYYFYCAHVFDYTLYMSQTTLPSMTQTAYENMFLPLPTKEEQYAIANQLDQICSKIDAVLEKTRASIEEYKKLKQAVITQAVTKGVRGDRPMKDSGIEWIGEIPAEWGVVPHKRIMHKVKEICEQYNGEDIISLTVNGVVKRDLTAGGKMPTSFDGYQYVEPNNLLLCLFDIDVTPRCVGVVRDYGVTSPAYSRFVMHDGYYNAYYDYLLRMIDDNKVFVHLSKNLRSSLTESDFGAIKTCAPPLAEQKCIAAFLDVRCDEIDALIAKKQQYLTEIENYKKSLIYEYVTGKKEVV